MIRKRSVALLFKGRSYLGMALLPSNWTDLSCQLIKLVGQRNIRNLKLEHDLLTKTNELLKKDRGVDPRLLSNREKTMLVHALREEYALRELLDRLNLPRSSYFYHRSPLRVADKYAEVRPAITEIFENAHCAYGYRRIQAALNRQRVFISEKIVRRLMKQAGHNAARPKRRRYRLVSVERSRNPGCCQRTEF